MPFGYDHKYVYSHIGYNLKVTDIQAAIGCAQLDRLDGFVRARRENHAFLSRELGKYGDRLLLPVATQGSEPAWFAFVVTVRETAGFQRNELTQHLESHKVETRSLFSGNLLRHPAFGDVDCRIEGDLENSDRITNDTFFVGVYPGLKEQELGYMVEVFDAFFEER